jgi:ABC-type multidrug transport system ATPase subunit
MGLHVDSVRKEFRGRQVLNDVFISCEPGEIVGLLGRNGSGKSTLLKIIFGSLSADNRFVSVDGKRLGSLYANRYTIGYLPQDSFLPMHIKIKSIIPCFCSPVNAAALLKHDLVKPWIDKKVTELSGGERRIIEVLLMINSDATYLMFDEPFNGIAPLHIDVLKELIKEGSKHKGFIITDHDYRNVIDISSRIILMDNGNTKKINALNDLVRFGYLPASRAL